MAAIHRNWEPGDIPRYNRDWLHQRVAEGAQPSYIMSWKPGAPGTPACLGQWQPSLFTVDGIRYTCTEQWMMAEKARLFGDAAVERQILATQEPPVMKQLGRKVSPFDPKVWNRARFAIVANGNYEKFTQDSSLRDYLLGTGEAVLVEASPMDTIWGIGLGVDNDRAQDPAGWRGLNLLGFALMEVRDEIARATI